MTKFTIVIPTRERCETLYYTIQSCLNQDYADYSVLVSDNQSTDRTREVVHSFSDSRLHYVLAPRRLSMSSHFNFAIGQVNEGWVTSIGDDDALLPGALKYADEIIRKYGGRSLAAPSVYYGWPELPDHKLANQLQFPALGSRVTVRDSKDVVRNRIRFRERRDEYVWGLPGVYRGFVPVDIIRAATRNGRYINSVTPDAYSAFATALLSPKFISTERPLFVEGVSARSNGAAQAMLANNDEEQRYLAENDIPLHRDTVYCPAPSFVMIEAFLQAKTVFPELAAGLDPDFRAMCLKARLEVPAGKLQAVQHAIAAVRKRYSLPMESHVSLILASLLHRVSVIRRVLRALSVDGNVFDVRNVYDASIVAGALWHYRCPSGHREGWRLVAERAARFLAKRMKVP